MILYCAPGCVYCHRVRIVLIEKNVSVEIKYINQENPQKAVLGHNPEASTPTLVDRDLVLTNSRIIMEYLNDRYPYPPLYPMGSVPRARARMAIHQIEQDWYTNYTKITQASVQQAQLEKQLLSEKLTGAESDFSGHPYLYNQEFSMIDCSLAPLLWRLPSLGISLPWNKPDAITCYCNRVFKHSSFRESLTDKDRDLAEPVFKNRFTFDLGYSA